MAVWEFPITLHAKYHKCSSTSQVPPVSFEKWFFSPKYMIRIPYKELVGNGNIINVSDRSLLFPCFTDHYLIKLDNKAPARDNFPLKKE